MSTWTLALPKRANGQTHPRIIIVGERTNAIKHFELEEISNLGLSEKESPHPLHSSWTPRPECIQIRPPNVNQEKRIDATRGIRELSLETKEGAGIALKRTEEVIAWAGTKKIIFLTWGGHVTSVLVCLAIYQEIVARKNGVTSRTPSVPAFWQSKNRQSKIRTKEALLMGHPPCTSLTARYRKVPRT
jgi:hypothetical protein